MNSITTLSKILHEFLSLDSTSTIEEKSTSTNTSELAVDKKAGVIVDRDKTTYELTSASNAVRAEADLDFEILDEKDTEKENVKEHDVDGVKQTLDDLRAGPFRYVMISGRFIYIFVIHPTTDFYFLLPWYSN
jgi:hypothetical protein